MDHTETARRESIHSHSTDVHRLNKTERFNTLPHGEDAAKRYKLFKRNLGFAMSQSETSATKLEILCCSIGADVYELIEETSTFEQAIQTLDSLFSKRTNEILARHLLATRKQTSDENIEQYIQALRTMAKDCNFKDVKAEEAKNESIRDSFIAGLKSTTIRQRLLENMELDLNKVLETAKTMQYALESMDHFAPKIRDFEASAIVTEKFNECNAVSRKYSNIQNKQVCFFCGNLRHPRNVCPARAAKCHSCLKMGHFAKVCRSNRHPRDANVSSILLAANDCGPRKYPRAVIHVELKNQILSALVDTGSSLNFLDLATAKRLGISYSWTDITVSMAASDVSKRVVGKCGVHMRYNQLKYKNIEFFIIPKLCSEVILGVPFLQLHRELRITTDGDLEPLEILLASTNHDSRAVSLFQNLTDGCHPIVTKSRIFNKEDTRFIESEIHKMLDKNIIESANSPWRAQVVVVKKDNGKKRLVVDFSRTINRYTLLDAYPLPKINTLVNLMAKNRYYSHIDLKDAYYQVPISPCERNYTAFEACGKLYRFTRIPMGVTNGVAAFQRFMNNLIETNKLNDTYTYIDDIIICGKTRDEHDENVRLFKNVAENEGLRFNEAKCKFGLTTIRVLGYEVSYNHLRPDPDRLKPLDEMIIPSNPTTLRRLLGFFAYYSCWIPHYSKKIQPLIDGNVRFPLGKLETNAITELKNDIRNSVLISIDEDGELVLETDASDNAIGATLLQRGQPVAFFSRTLTSFEKRYHIIEKEALALVDAVKNWKCFLTSRPFIAITDQRSVSFMYNQRHPGKIRNDRILRWKLELSNYTYEIQYRPGKNNKSADLLSRDICATLPLSLERLRNVHCSLAHPGVTRLLHYVKENNLPYSVEEIRKISSECIVCNEIKPRYYKPISELKLIKSTSPFERLSLDFKGPLPRSTDGYSYLFVAIDEFSRYPIVFATRDCSSETVKACLRQIFAIFGCPSYIHSDRGSCFKSTDLREWLSSLRVCLSHTTSFRPEANGQCERYNGTIWKTINLLLKEKGWHITRWSEVLPEALSSIRSLLCTSTGQTPHDRIFRFQRRFPIADPLPDWLKSGRMAFLQRMNNRSKYEGNVDKVQILESNEKYCRIQHADGRPDTVSTQRLAPASSSDERVEDTDLQINKEGDSPSKLDIQECNDHSSVNTQETPKETRDENGQNSNAFREGSTWITENGVLVKRSLRLQNTKDQTCRENESR